MRARPGIRRLGGVLLGRVDVVGAWLPEGTDGPPPQPAIAYTELAQRLVAALNDPATGTGEFTADDYAPPPPWAAYDHAAAARTFPPASDARWDPERDIVPVEYRLCLAGC